jgi:hypothetical protein
MGGMNGCRQLLLRWTRLLSPIFQVIFLNWEGGAESLGHVRGKTASAALVIADHILSYVEFLGQLPLRQSRLKPCPGKKVSALMMRKKLCPGRLIKGPIKLTIEG